MFRRNFIKTAGLGSMGAMAATGNLPEPAISAVNSVPEMKIKKIDVVRDQKYQGRSLQQMWVRLYTDNGIVGVGETYWNTEAQVGVLKDKKDMILGHDAIEMTTFMDDFRNNSWGGSSGADMKIISALNMAQWDILGKAANMPVYKLLGGKYRPEQRLYNTSNAVADMTMEKDAEKMTKFFMDKGIKGVKIWPYDTVAAKNKGSYISPSERDKCLDWIKRIRNTAGKDFEIAIEFHTRWNLPSALNIAKDLEPYDVMWLEDILGEDNMDSYSILCRDTTCPVAVSERLATKFRFREVLERKAADIIILDIAWCGGISEAKKIVDMADAYYIPFATHNYGGPVLWMSSIHLGTAAKNCYITESSWEMYSTVFPYFIKNTPVPVNGFVKPPEGPGLGIEFSDEPIKNGDARVEIIGETR
ncbi:MAG TPA: mandelate racemase/muconate lactonizing enzyme family protein [Bacteroidales bacterium]|nr:mandelate racemase/muconate lactonizing enzyme family protein [Bacteroidales bacterium]